MSKFVSAIRVGAFLVMFFSVVWAKNEASGQPTASELLAEARACYHLDLLTDEPARLAIGARSALSFVDELLARTDLTGAQRLQATRLKLRIADRARDEALFETTFNALPATISGMTEAEWTRRKTLWMLLHLASQNRWTEVRAGITAFPSDPPLTGEARADWELLRVQAGIRYPGAIHQAYAQLADLVANSGSIQLDPLYDPYYGRTEFRHLDGLKSWNTVEQVLQTLEPSISVNELSRRRWFEILAPSIDPLKNHFPNAPAERLLQFESQLKTLAVSFPPSIPVEPTGGYRELLAHAMRCEDFRWAGRHKDAHAYVQSLPEQISGVPDALWQAYKTSWQVNALCGMLAFPQIVKLGEPAREQLTLLPLRNEANGFAFGSYCAAKIHTFNGEGFVGLAEYLNQGIEDPRSAKLIYDLFARDLPNVPFQAVLNKFNERPNVPTALIGRTLFLLKRMRYVPETDRRLAKKSALRSAARALHILETAHSPSQLELREEALPQILSAVKDLFDSATADRVVLAMNQPISDNSELESLLEEDLVAAGEAYVVESITQFDALAAKITSHGDDHTSDTLDLSEIGDLELASAAEKMPVAYRNARDLATANKLLTELASRGQARLGLSDSQWLNLRLKRAEILLLEEETFDQAIQAIQSIAMETSPTSDTLVIRVREQAAAATDAFDSMSTLAGFLWAIEWSDFISNNVRQMKHMPGVLSTKLAQAYETPLVQNYFNDPLLSDSKRTCHRMALGFSLFSAGKYDEAEQIYTYIANDTSLAAGNKIKLIAESWKVSIWYAKARVEVNETIRRQLCEQIINYVRARGPKFLSGEAEETMLHYGRWAAREISDTDAIIEFQLIANQLTGIPS